MGENDKKIYFIFSLNGENSEVYKIDKNEGINNIQLIKEAKIYEYAYSLYSLTISAFQDKNVSLLLTKSREQYIASIEYYKQYPIIFLYKIDFKPFSKALAYNLNQLIVPYSEQFRIFKNIIVKDNNDLLKYLCLSSLDFIHNSSLINRKENLVENMNFEFDYFLYLFINCLFLSEENKNAKLLNNFFDEFNTDLINVKKSFNKNNSNKVLIEEISNPFTLASLQDFKKINQDIMSMAKNNESINKLDILLAYYYFTYKKKIFINFISDKNDRKDKVLSNLDKNRKLFLDFSSEIMDFDILNEADNLLEMLALFTLMPNLPELMKVFSLEELHIKFVYLSKKEGKVCNFVKILKPNKNDNIELIQKYYSDLIKNAKKDKYIGFILSNDFFLDYCELFYEENLKNIEILIDIYKDYNMYTISPYENIEEELYSYYYETGLYLIKCGKLTNMDAISFIDKANKYSIKKKMELPDEVYNSIVITKDNLPFINNFLNGEYKLGNDYMKFINNFFKNFKTLKDFLNLTKWEKECCKNEEILFICFDTLKNLWIKEKDKENTLSKSLITFIAELFIILSKKKNDFINELKNLEKTINNKKIFLKLFSIILTKSSYKPHSFLEFIDNYIVSNTNEEEPLTIYYRVLTLSTDKRMNYLQKNLKIEFSIRVEDFIKFPNIIEDRILLFVNLYQERFFFEDHFYLQDHEYFKKSIEAKDKINTLKYKDAINMSKYMTDFQPLFLFFLPRRINEDNDYLIDTLLIDFYENCNKCKEQYDSLKLILNYWKHFFNISKKYEINNLINFLNTLENTPIIDFNKYSVNIDSFLFYLNEAQTKDKLFNSFFFMGLYQDNSINDESEKFNYTLLRFNELKLLGHNSNIKYLPADLVNKLIELVYKNNDRLDDELLLLKEYFEFDKAEDISNFDINKIKREFTTKVNNYKIYNNLDDYDIEFDDFTLINGDNLNANDNVSNRNIIKTNKVDIDDDFNLFSNDADDGGFSLFGENLGENENVAENGRDIEKVQAKKEIKPAYINENQKKELLKEINQNSNDYYIIYRINIINDDNAFRENNSLFEERFKALFWETFKNIDKYNELSEKDFYEEIIIKMTKIFLSAIGNNYFKKENNNNKQIYLIYDFYEILEIYKKYHLINKLQFKKLIERILECKESEDGEDEKIIGSIDHLLVELKENDKLQKKDLSNLFINILIKQKINHNYDEFNKKIIKLFLRDDYKYILNDSIPLLDQLLKEDIDSKIKFNEYVSDFTKFGNYLYKEIEKKCKISKDLEELLLYYFESKITMIFKKNKKLMENNENIYQNEYIQNYLKQCLNALENYKNQENERISILFCIAFVKCFLSNYIKDLYKYNQEIGNVKDINDNIIKGYGKNAFRTSIKLYILKLFFYLIGNFKDFLQFNYNNYQIDYFSDKDIEDLVDNNNNNKNNLYGFDYLLISHKKDEFEEYKSIEDNFYNLIINNNDSYTILSIINKTNNLDIFICVIINIFISNYHKKEYFHSKEFGIISKWIIDKINNNKFYKFNDLFGKILLLFADINNYKNKIIKINENINYDNLNYNQLLIISFSLRYVLNTILYSNKNNLFYQLLLNGKNTIIKNKDYFNDYKDYSNIEQNLTINHLTFSIIRFIILSHLYFSYLLDNISLNDINTLFMNNENGSTILGLLENEFDLIKKIIQLKGVKNIIVFMNFVFNDIKSHIIGIESSYNETDNRTIESNIEDEINKYLENFDFYIEKYNTFRNTLKMKEEKNDFKNLIFEDKEFYNNKKIENKYPYITYLAITNFSSIDDFKNQFNYLNNEKDKYPMINCIINNLEIIKISSYLPFINSFFNKVYNELALKIKKEDADKEINNYISENIQNDIKKYNKIITEIKKLKSFSNHKLSEINNESKISEIINIKGNSINLLFDTIIKIYNEFLINTKIYNNYKKYLQPIIIQNTSKNDYYILNEDNNSSIYDKLEEIICLYSKRNRYNKNMLNVYNGNKINYDFEQIEMLLQKEYLYGKRTFQLEQRHFIFANEIFMGERYNLIDNLKNKYPQVEIKEEITLRYIDNFMNNENQIKFEEIYINLNYILIYLIMYDTNNYNCENTSLEYIAQIVQKSNYHINDLLMEFLKDNKNSILINHLLFLYQKVEIKCFGFKVGDIYNEIIEKDINEEKKRKIMDYFNNDKLLLKEEAILNSIKKYILRYCIGNYENKNEIKKKIDFEKILNKSDLWDDSIYTQDNFKKEIKDLININNENNCLMKYFLNKLSELKKEKEKEKIKEIVAESEIDIIEKENKPKLPRKKTRRNKIHY